MRAPVESRCETMIFRASESNSEWSGEALLLFEESAPLHEHCHESRVDERECVVRAIALSSASIANWHISVDLHLGKFN